VWVIRRGKGLLLINDLRRHLAAVSPALQQAIARVIDSGWLIMGHELEQFEQEFAHYCGADFALGVANGTEAIEIGLRALGVDRGKLVATVANAGFYTTTAVRSIGAEPVYVDVLSDTYLMDIKHLEAALQSQKVEVILVTHLYGQMHDMPKIMTLAARAGCKVLEDCAQAHGAILENQRAGSFGDAASFSFYPTKNLGALGDGGAITTSQPDVAKRVTQLRQYGWEGKYRVVTPGGRNSRLDELQAAVLRAKLPLLDGWNNRRRQIARYYTNHIVHPKVQTPQEPDAAHVAHLYVVRSKDRDGLRNHLKSSGIAADVHYPIPDTLQPVWGKQKSWPALPVTEMLAGEVLSFPCFPEMTDKEVANVTEAVNRW
jgi:aminotransferase EvaB